MPPELLAAVYNLTRHNAVLQDPALGVNIFQEQIERGDALGQALLDHSPFGSGDHAGQQVVGEDFLGAFFAAVHRKGDALVQKGKIGRLLAPFDFCRRQGTELIHQHFVVRAQLIRLCEHFVVGTVQHIPIQVRAQGIQRLHVFG